MSKFLLLCSLRGIRIIFVIKVYAVTRNSFSNLIVLEDIHDDERPSHNGGGRQSIGPKNRGVGVHPFLMDRVGVWNSRGLNRVGK